MTCTQGLLEKLSGNEINISIHTYITYLGVLYTQTFHKNLTHEKMHVLSAPWEGIVVERS